MIFASPAEYLNLTLRAHELLRDVPLYDVSMVDLPGGGDGRRIADIRALDSRAAPSPLMRALFGVRHLLGRLFRWDRAPIRLEDSRLSRLSESDRRDSEIAPGTREGSFLVLYRFPTETLSEIRNATVHGFICMALTRTATGYRLYFAVYVLPVSWLTRPYLMAIQPFRRILYPAMLRRIQRAWVATYGARSAGVLAGWFDGVSPAPRVGSETGTHQQFDVGKRRGGAGRRHISRRGRQRSASALWPRERLSHRLHASGNAMQQEEGISPS